MTGTAQQSDALDTALETGGVRLDEGRDHTEKGTKQYVASATVFTVNTLTLTATGTPVPILNADPTRVRALIKASAADVFVGKLSDLANIAPDTVPNGYPLPSGGGTGDEFKCIDELYVAYRPASDPAEAVYVSAMIERLTV